MVLIELLNFRGLKTTKKFKIISSGERDADSDNLENSISASKMREYAKEEDYDSFAKGAGCSKSLIRDMYDSTRKGMGL